ncbi:hypothetical protein G6F42_019158 [Rhizopus arrhizus]|nr:hypothetical protein G6F42_019158 [Rhizopus arrhizus]
MSSVFYYEDGQDNLYDENGMKVDDPMEDVLTEVNDPNIVLETLTNQKTYFDQKPLEKLVVDKVTNGVKSEKRTTTVSVYTNYSDKEREQFIDKMIECAQEKGAAARVARSMGINVRNAQKWWKHTFTEEHDSFLIKLIDNDPQIIVSDIMEMLIVEFEGFSISNSQLNHHLKNDLCLTMKKATLEAEARNSPDSDLDFTRNCVFIHEAGFHVNMRFNYARSAAGTRARVKTKKTRSPSHTIIGAIHSGSVLLVQLRKPPSKKELLGQQTPKKRKTTIKGVKRAASPPPEDKANPPKGTTTAHFIKFINELLDVMDLDEKLKGCYLLREDLNEIV